MESSSNQIIMNTIDASGVIRNINYSPDKNINIINYRTIVPGSNVNITDSVTLDMFEKTVSISYNLGFNSSFTLNSQYGIINIIFDSSMSGNTSGYVTFTNSIINTSSIVHLKCIHYSSTINGTSAYPFTIIKNINNGSCDITLCNLTASLPINTIVKYFFYIY